MIVMLLISLLAVGATVLIGKSLVTSIIRDNTVIKKKVAADKQLTSNLQAAPQLVESYGSLGDKAGLVADALPTRVDFPSLIVTLENMTNNSGLKLKSVAPTVADAVEAVGAGGDPSTPPSPKTYKYAINFSGSYDGLTRFLGLVETSARPMRVVDLQITGSGSALTGQMDLETFYQDKAQLPFGTETVK